MKIKGIEHLEDKHVRFIERLHKVTGVDFEIKVTQNTSWGWAREDGKITVPPPWLELSDNHWKITVIHEVTHLVVGLDENHNKVFWRKFYDLACQFRLRKYAVKHMQDWRTGRKVLQELRK